MMTWRRSSSAAVILVVAIAALSTLACGGGSGQAKRGSAAGPPGGGGPLPQPAVVANPWPDVGGEVRTLYLAVDDSGSMAGYARGNGCFDRLWLDVFDRTQGELSVEDIVIWRVGATVRRGPEQFSKIKTFASEAAYTEPRTVIQDFFESREVFTSEDPPASGLVVAFVSDLEADVTNPDPECAGNGSVVCLVKALRRLQDDGWSLAVVGFTSPFRGKRYYPRFLETGEVDTNAFNVLEGAEVPVYVFLAARDRGLVWRFAQIFSSMLGKCVEPAVLDLGEPLPPRVDLRVREGLQDVYLDFGGKKKRVGGLLHLDELRREATVRIGQDAHSVVLSIPFRLSFEPHTVWQPGCSWELSVEASAVGRGVRQRVKLAADVREPDPVKAQGGGLDRELRVMIPGELLRRAGRGGFAVDVILRGHPRLDGSFDPWARWSYEFPAEDEQFETKTFRTANVFKEVLKRAAEDVGPTVLSSLRIGVAK